MWVDLAKKVASVQDLVIGEIDATENDVEDIHIKQYPTIMIFSKERKHGEEYTGERDVESVL